MDPKKRKTRNAGEAGSWSCAAQTSIVVSNRRDGRVVHRWVEYKRHSRRFVCTHTGAHTQSARAVAGTRLRLSCAMCVRLLNGGSTFLFYHVQPGHVPGHCAPAHRFPTFIRIEVRARHHQHHQPPRISISTLKPYESRLLCVDSKLYFAYVPLQPGQLELHPGERVAKLGDAAVTDEELANAAAAIRQHGMAGAVE